MSTFDNNGSDEVRKWYKNVFEDDEESSIGDTFFPTDVAARRNKTDPDKSKKTCIREKKRKNQSGDDKHHKLGITSNQVKDAITKIMRTDEVILQYAKQQNAKKLKTMALRSFARVDALKDRLNHLNEILDEFEGEYDELLSNNDDL